jgi:hypothetical protein
MAQQQRLTPRHGSKWQLELKPEEVKTILPIFHWTVLGLYRWRRLLEDDWRMGIMIRRYLATLTGLTMILGLATLSPAQNPGVEKTSGTGLCAKCMLHMTSQCQNAIVVESNGRSQVYLLKDNPVSKAFHKEVCKTSIPVVVEGRLIRASDPGESGSVIVGEIEPSKLTVDDCEIPEVVTLAGIGKCAKCALSQSPECRNVIVCHLDGKDVTYWLTDNSVSKAFHKTICKTNEPILVTGKREAKDTEGREFFTAVKLELIRPPSSRPGTDASDPTGKPQSEQTLSGAAWCDKCRHSRGQECQIVVRIIIGGKNLDYWLVDNETSRALHAALKNNLARIKVTGVILGNASVGGGGIVEVSKYQLNP